MKNPLSLEAFADWASKQPVDQTYDWGDEDGCAAAQYARHLGLDVEYHGRCSTFWWEVDQIALRDDFIPNGYIDTFGALAHRLRSA